MWWWIVVGVFVVVVSIALYLFIFKKDDDYELLDYLGDAREATYEDLKNADIIGKLNRNEIYLGLTPSSITPKKADWVSYSGNSHLITIAPSRSGKFRDVLSIALSEYKNSILAIDPKGQMAAVTARARRELGQEVFILNPFDILPDILGKSARFNPLATLDPKSNSFGVDCDNIADALIWNTGGDSHWTDSAKELISGLIMYFVAYELPGACNICSPYSAFNAAIEKALACGDDIVIGKLGRFYNSGDNKEILSIISTAKTQTAFLGNEAIRDNLSDSDFRFSDLKKEGITVYLVLPTRYLGACSKWFRLIVASALDDLLREEKGNTRVLMILDEFAQLGRLTAIENAMALAAGYDVQMWPILQDLTQLQALYDKNWETFLANTGVKQFFAPRDVTTSEYISKLCGVRTIHPVTRSRQNNNEGSNLTHSQSIMQRPLYYPDEIRRLKSNQQLIFFDSIPHVALIYRSHYNKKCEIFDPDPYHLEPENPDSTENHNGNQNSSQ